MRERKPEYPDSRCKVTVTFTDGEVKEYEIPTGAGIAAFLAKQCGETGMLVLLNGGSAHTIPVGQIKEYRLDEIGRGTAQ